MIAAAMGLFRDRGFEAVTMEQIAGAADIAKGTRYSHFPVKEAIVAAYLDRASVAHHAERVARLRALPDTRARLTASLTELIAAVRAQPEIFAKYFTDRLPRDATSRHVLFKSMVTGLPTDAWLNEQAVNDALSNWIRASRLQGLDHVSLRRFLVDAGYLGRRPDGSGYRVAPTAPGQPAFEPGVERLDIGTVLEARRAEIARRKAAYLAKAEGNEARLP